MQFTSTIVKLTSLVLGPRFVEPADSPKLCNVAIVNYVDDDFLVACDLKTYETATETLEQVTEFVGGQMSE